MKIKISTEKCTRCKKCIKNCYFGAIKTNEDKVFINEDCRLCGVCITSCTSKAISYIKPQTKNVMDIDSYSGVWVYCQHNDNGISSVSKELVSEGRILAETLNVNLSTVIIGEDIEEAAKSLMEYGVDYVYKVEHSSLKNFNDEIYTDVICQLVETYKPEIFLIGATYEGKSLAPRVASRLNTGLTADCTELEIHRERKILIQRRPALGGNIMASIICPHHRPQMATVRCNVLKETNNFISHKGKIIVPKVKIPKEIRVRTINHFTNSLVNVHNKDSKIIVSAGKGFGSSKNLNLIWELAELLGAEVGASRAIVDDGWVNYSHQIGQTGKTVRSKIYIACGISGSIQHIAGMSSCETILAINKDKNAPIFKVARYGIVGDVLEIIPALINEIKLRIHRKG